MIVVARLVRRTVAGTVAAALVAGLLVLAAPSALAATASSLTVSTSIGPQVGSQFHALWSDYTNAQRVAVLDRLAAAGVKWVRIDMGWSSVQEVSRDQYSQWYIDLADFVVDAARARGINVLATFWRTPAWANGGQSVVTPPSNVNDYAQAAYWVANHWRGRVAAWEVWNEPNLDGSWNGTVSQYVNLLRAAYPMFKAGDPGAKVLIGGPSSNDTNWLAAAYQAGAQGSFDVMATHPYQGMADAPPETPDDGNIWWITHTPPVKSLMTQYGDGAKEIWFTEFGWSSHDNWSGVPNWDRGVTEQQQADYFVRTLQLVKANYPYVTNVFWYKERNGVSGDVQLDNYGLLKRDLTAKPVLDTLAAYLTAPAPPPANGTLTGTVTRRSGTPISGVTVGWTGPVSGSTLTASNGTYSKSLPPGTYTVKARKSGWRTVTATVSVPEGTTLTKNFVLVRS